MTIARKVLCIALIAGLLTPAALGARPALAESEAYPEPTEGAQLSAPGEHQAGYQAGAVLASMFSVPGKVILCTAGGLAGLGLMLATFGTGYKPAKYFVEEGCGGRWVVTPDDLRRANAEIARRSIGQ
jgi:hypothetical protein